MTFIAYVDFTKEQQSQIDNAFKNETSLKIHLKNDQFLENGNFHIKLSKLQVEQIKKGTPITLSKAAIKSLGNQIKNFIIKEIKDKTGGLLPILAALPFIAGAAGIAGGISGVVSAVNQKKHQNKMEEETKRHNKALEELVVKKSGSGLYMRKNLKKH